MTEGITTTGPRRNTTQKDVDLEQVRNRGQMQLAAVRGVMTAACIAVSTYPLKFFYFAVKELAGKDTKLSVGLTIGLSVAGVAGFVKIVVDSRKMRAQAKEIVRLRERCAVLEDRERQTKKRPNTGVK